MQNNTIQLGEKLSYENNLNMLREFSKESKKFADVTLTSLKRDRSALDKETMKVVEERAKLIEKNAKLLEKNLKGNKVLEASAEIVGEVLTIRSNMTEIRKALPQLRDANAPVSA
jgi:hypothetical protein